MVGSKLVIFGGFGPVVKGDESEDESGEADDIDDVGNITGSNLTLTGSEDSNVPPCLELIRFGDVHIFDASQYLVKCQKKIVYELPPDVPTLINIFN